jgi:hypothetical protein
MKTRLRWSFTITICTLLMVNIALPQETLKQDSSATVTIVTAGDVSVTRAADGKTAVSINFVPGKAKSDDTRITISGPYSLDVNGGVKEVKSPQGVELHVLSHEELRFEAPEIGLWEQSHKFSQNSACMKIPKYPVCGNPVCDQSGHPGDQCRYNSGSGCSCVAAGGGPCSVVGVIDLSPIANEGRFIQGDVVKLSSSSQIPPSRTISLPLRQDRKPERLLCLGRQERQ